jgi:hypothetical protein
MMGGVPIIILPIGIPDLLDLGLAKVAACGTLRVRDIDSGVGWIT